MRASGFKSRSFDALRGLFGQRHARRSALHHFADSEPARLCGCVSQAGLSGVGGGENLRLAETGLVAARIDTGEDRPATRGPVRIPPQSGVAFTLRRGEVLRVTDPLGEQVSDLYAFKQDDLDCSLSSGRSIDYASKIYFSTGDVLYSNDSRRMFTILEDRVGRHDFLLTPCSQEMFEILYKHEGHHPSCFENLYTPLAAYGVKPSQIGTTFNIFMKVDVEPDGAVRVKPPISKAGDFVELRADMDLVCALTACSAEQSNNGTFKPIDFEIIQRPCAGD